jgi:hypothetical protein
MRKRILGREEARITAISLRNLFELAPANGGVVLIVHSAADAQRPIEGAEEHWTRFIFGNGMEYVANGFACGYLGEGPNGLAKAIRDYLHRPDITIEHVAGWVGTGKVYVITANGNGKCLVRYPCVCDGEFDVEIW